MSRIIKNMAPYWKSVIAIFVLLVVQAVCDLSLPSYTSDIIDVGIQNGGLEHILPKKMTAEEYKLAQTFMTQEEITRWNVTYVESSDDMYECIVKGEKELDELDEVFLPALVLNNQMCAIPEDKFKSQIAEQNGIDISVINEMSIDDIGNMIGMKLNTSTQMIENEDGEEVETTCVDMRQMFAVMLKTGKISRDDLVEMRDSFQETIDTLGSSLVKSMGIAYAKRVNTEAGIDMDKLQTNYLWISGLKMLGMALLMTVCAISVGFLASRIGAGIGRDLRTRLYTNVMGFSNAEMEKFSTASLITRTTNDVQQIQNVSVMLLRMILYAPILGVGGIIKVVGTNAGMGWVIALAVIVIIGFVLVLMSVAMPKFKLMQKLVDNVNLVSREILTGLSVIRAFGREKHEEERFDEANRKLTKTMLFTNRTMTFMMPVMMMIMNGLSILIVWVASHRIDSGVMQVGDMTAFITYSMMIVMSFLMLTMLSIMLPRAMVAADRIDEVLKTHSSIEDPDAPKKVAECKGVITFDHVSFKYPEADACVIEDISFTAKPGETTAIIGSTGCGKSTLVNLIPRLYDVTEGRVLLDDVDIRQLSMHDLRKNLGYVPQKGMLFFGTIASNLRFGKADASDEDIEEAATIAQATDFIEENPQKYESPIAQGGSNVSGGQKQRLSIARAIAKNPKVFIFDDSFSALDLKTDAALRKALSKKTAESTVIIVAQRVSTIMHAEQIIVMDDGKIVGKGTHEELLANCETYQQIASSQLSAKELGKEA